MVLGSADKQHIVNQKRKRGSSSKRFCAITRSPNSRFKDCCLIALFSLSLFLPLFLRRNDCPLLVMIFCSFEVVLVKDMEKLRNFLFRKGSSSSLKYSFSLLYFVLLHLLHRNVWTKQKNSCGHQEDSSKPNSLLSNHYCKCTNQ